MPDVAAFPDTEVIGSLADVGFGLIGSVVEVPTEVTVYVGIPVMEYPAPEDIAQETLQQLQLFKSRFTLEDDTDLEAGYYTVLLVSTYKQVSAILDVLKGFGEDA